jgi:hypothetical protein
MWAHQGHPDARVVCLLSDLGYLDAVSVKLDAVIALNAAYFFKDGMHMRLFCQPKPQQVDITRRPQRDVKPHVKKQRPFEKKIVFTGRHTEPVEHAFESITRQNQREVLIAGFGFGKKPRKNRCR